MTSTFNNLQGREHRGNMKQISRNSTFNFQYLHQWTCGLQPNVLLLI